MTTFLIEFEYLANSTATISNTYEAENKYKAMIKLYDERMAKGHDVTGKIKEVFEKISDESILKVGDIVIGSWKGTGVTGTISKITKSNYQIESSRRATTIKKGGVAYLKVN